MMLTIMVTNMTSTRSHPWYFVPLVLQFRPCVAAPEENFDNKENNILVWYYILLIHTNSSVHLIEKRN